MIMITKVFASVKTRKLILMQEINDLVCYTTITLDSLGGLTKLNFLEYANFKSRIQPLESQVNTVSMRCCSASDSRGSVIP